MFYFMFPFAFSRDWNNVTAGFPKIYRLQGTWEHYSISPLTVKMNGVEGCRKGGFDGVS